MTFIKCLLSSISISWQSKIERDGVCRAAVINWSIVPIAAVEQQSSMKGDRGQPRHICPSQESSHIQKGLEFPIVKEEVFLFIRS